MVSPDLWITLTWVSVISFRTGNLIFIFPLIAEFGTTPTSSLSTRYTGLISNTKVLLSLS